MRQIKASEIKPGMTIEWSQLGIKYTCVVSSIEPARSQISQEIMASGGGEATLYNNTPVTVLSEPAPAQPKEPTAFGARVVVKGRRFLRSPEDKCDVQAWLEEGDGIWRDWDELCAMGPVTVVPDQGWTAPDDTPEVPERINEWPEDDEHLRAYKWMDFGGFLWLYGGDGEWRFVNRSGIPSYPHPRPGDGPWTRVTGA